MARGNSENHQLNKTSEAQAVTEQQRFVDRFTSIYESLTRNSHIPSIAEEFIPLESNQRFYITLEWTHMRGSAVMYQISVYMDISQGQRSVSTSQYVLSSVRNPSKTSDYIVRLEHKRNIQNGNHPSSFHTTDLAEFQNDPVLNKILEYLEAKYVVRSNV